TSGPRSCKGSLSRKYCCTSTTIRHERSHSIRPLLPGFIASILRRLRRAQAFEPRSARLRLEPLTSRRSGGLGGMARLGRRGGAPDQVDEPLARLLAVAFLCAVALGNDDQHTLGGEPPSGQALQPPAHVG